MLSAMLWYTRNGAVRVTQIPFSYSCVGRMFIPGRAGSLDPEQVVVRRRELALPPARFVDGLRYGDRGRDAVPLLRRDRSRRHQADERLLGSGARHARRLACLV